MTPLTPEQEARLHPPVRYDISKLKPIANIEVSPGLRDRTPTMTRILHGQTGNGMFWIATQDLDGQIEMSFSFQHRRPRNWDILSFFKFVGMTYLQEESRATGKVRHIVVQKGRLN